MPRLRLRSRTAAIVGVALVGAAGGTAVGFARLPAAHHSVLRAGIQWRAGAKRAPAIRLRDQRGRPFELSDARGSVVVLTFLDSRCRLQCPLEARQLTAAWRAVGARPATLVVVSTDPWGDTPAYERRFASRAHWTMRWRWLSGTAAQLRPFWRAYGIGVERQKGDVAHGVGLYLIDPNGFERAAYLPPFLPRDLAHDVRALAA